MKPTTKTEKTLAEAKARMKKLGWTAWQAFKDLVAIQADHGVVCSLPFFTK